MCILTSSSSFMTNFDKIYLHGYLFLPHSDEPRETTASVVRSALIRMTFPSAVPLKMSPAKKGNKYSWQCITYQINDKWVKSSISLTIPNHNFLMLNLQVWNYESGMKLARKWVNGHRLTERYVHCIHYNGHYYITHNMTFMIQILFHLIHRR